VVHRSTANTWRAAWSSPENTAAQRRDVEAGYRALHASMAMDKFRGAAHQIAHPRGAALTFAYGMRHAGRALRGHP
jgi:hypothetical protein